MPTLPAPLVPDGDGSGSGWVTQAGSSSNLYATVDETTTNDADYITSTVLQRPGEFVVLHVQDDTRFDDYWHQILAGSAHRPGDYALDSIYDNLIAPGVVFSLAACDIAYCAPSRLGILTGNYANNHGLDDVAAGTGYNRCRTGKFLGDPLDDVRERTLGPWDFDLSQKVGQYLLDLNASDALGLRLVAGTRVTSTEIDGHASCSTATRTSGSRKGYNSTLGIFDGTNATDGSPAQLWSTTEDDLQAYTGNIFNWIGRTDRADFTAIVGKLHNYSGKLWLGTYGTYDGLGSITHAQVQRYVQPGVGYACILHDDIQDHYRFKTCEYSGGLAANPADGDGAVGDECFYNALLAISAVSWSSGEVTVTLSQRPRYWRNGTATYWDLEVGDEVAVRRVLVSSSHDNGFNVSKATVTWVSGDGTQFKYAVASNPGTPSLTTGAGTKYSHVVPHKMLGEQVMRLRLSEFMEDAAVDRSTRGLVWWGTRMPHGSLLTYNDGAADGAGVSLWGTSDFNQYDVNCSPRYRNPRQIGNTTTEGLTIDIDDHYAWNGVAGDMSPAVDTTPSGGNIKTWGERGAMLADADDAFAAFYTDLAARRGVTADGEDAWTDILVGDNGWDQLEFSTLEDDTGSPIGAKLSNRDGSQRLMFVVRRPGWTPPFGTVTTKQIRSGVDQNVVRDAWVAHVDIPLTILDWFGLTSHHAHTTRDGLSLERDRFESSGTLRSERAIPGYGKYLSVPYTPSMKHGYALRRASDNLVLRRRWDNTSLFEINDMTPDAASPVGASDDWGTDDESAGMTAAQIAEFQSQLNAYLWEGFDPATGENALHDRVVGS